MTDTGIKRLILVTALEADLQGMIAENKQREIQGFSMAYTDEHFSDIASQMNEIATKSDDEIKALCIE